MTLRRKFRSFAIEFECDDARRDEALGAIRCAEMRFRQAYRWEMAKIRAQFPSAPNPKPECPGGGS